MKNKFLRFFKKYHSILSFVVVLPLILFSISGIILNHRELFSSIDLSRSWMPANYKFNNWNNAAVKGSVEIGKDSALIFGNVGVYLATENYSKFENYNAGFAEGTDNHKIYDLIKTSDHSWYAGTLFGIFYFNPNKKAWEEIELPVHHKRITSLVEKDQVLHIFTRSELFKMPLGTTQLTEFKLPKPTDFENKVGLFKTLWIIHSGEIFGTVGKLVVDLTGIIFIIISFTGVFFFTFRKYFKTGKFAISREKRVVYKKTNMRWHNQIGLYTAIILIITTATGIFLRPPLLIPIANKYIGKIKYTILDTPNPWFDRIRAVLYDDQLQRWVFATSEGFYFSDNDFASDLQPYPYQPPVSVMGVNVLKNSGKGTYLVGSFSGIYRWFPDQYAAQDYLTGEMYQPAAGMTSPFGNAAVAGYLVNGFGQEFWFDYSGGAFPVATQLQFAEMPAEITSEKISLWNVALEFHVGRMYEVFMGPFYILVVPISGLIVLFLIGSGVYLWFKMYWVRKKNKS